MTFGVGPVARHKEYYKGEGGGFPPNPSCDKSCEFMYAHGSSMHQEFYNYALTNLLFGLCKPIWIVDSLVIFHSPYPRVLTCLFYPPKCCKLENASQLFFLLLFPPLNSHLSFTRSLGVCQGLCLSFWYWNIIKVWAFFLFFHTWDISFEQK
jgi:hypothetical protein